MVKFFKYHGLGNDFIIIDETQNQTPELIETIKRNFVKRICHRHFGIGADGLIFTLPPQNNNDVRIQIYNSDGSEAEMCGNGVRCIVKFLLDNHKVSKDQDLLIETLAGPIKASVNKNNEISVDMGRPFLDPSQIPTTLKTNLLGVPEGFVEVEDRKLKILGIGMGNPHMIVRVNDLSVIPFENWGKLLEIHPTFPSKTNVHFVEVQSRELLKIQVWERGCGPTLACGTGACASVVAMKIMGYCNSNVKVKLPGGELNIFWPKQESNIIMKGEAKKIYSGRFDLSNFVKN